MSERKTLHKYYPIDFDPSKIPKLKHKQKEKNKLWGIRVMAPFNMRCNTCGEYIYKGKKFNSRKETVSDEDYLGMQIHRFYIRCPKCVAVIAFKTDYKNCDYICEAGATRNFEAGKTLEEMEKKRIKEKEEEEAANPMKVLENRTKQSRNEMETIEALTELREMNARHERVDYEGMIRKNELYQQELQRLQQEEEDRTIRELFRQAGGESSAYIRRIEIASSDDESDDSVEPKPETSTSLQMQSPTDLLMSGAVAVSDSSDITHPSLPTKRAASTKSILAGLVKVKKPNMTSALSAGEDNQVSLHNDKEAVPSGVKRDPLVNENNSANISSCVVPVIKESAPDSNSVKINGLSSTGASHTGALSLIGCYAPSSSDDSD